MTGEMYGITSRMSRHGRPYDSRRAWIPAYCNFYTKPSYYWTYTVFITCVSERAYSCRKARIRHTNAIRAIKRCSIYRSLLQIAVLNKWKNNIKPFGVPLNIYYNVWNVFLYFNVVGIWIINILTPIRI